MLNPCFDDMPVYPFQRLDALLRDVSPPRGREPTLLQIGEPQGPPPPMLAEILARHAGLWNRYPPNNGTGEFREAIAGWLARRFRVAADPRTHIAPCPGSREALFLIGLCATPRRKNGARPTILLPNPHYHSYPGTGAMAGAEIAPVPASRETGFLPDFGAVDREVLDRAALAFVCTPSNPEGAVADRARFEAWIRLAREHDFVLVIDGCYSEIYTGEPPLSGLEACAGLGPGERDDPFDRVVFLNSLSKRSSAAGLRSGFVAGDREIVRRFVRLVGNGGTPTPMPIQNAAVEIWSDETHVEINRARYRANFEIAESLFADSHGYRMPAGGMFLWLDVGDGEETARRLWREAAVKVMPGAYMGVGNGDRNPGTRFIRAALVHEPETTGLALEALKAAL